MPESWTRVHDLHLDLTPGVGRRVALENALRQAIRSGALSAGTALPSSRSLAADLGLARGTVVEAYAQLSAEGYLRSRARSGTQVATGPVATAAAPAPPRRDPAPIRIDLRPITADVNGFPRTAWLGALRHALTTAPDTALRYGDSQGDEQLRGALATYLGRSRGVRTTPDRIVVCAGFSHGLSLLCQALARAGATTLAVEDPSLRPSRDTAEHAGLATVGVPIDDRGLRVDELGAVDACLVTPAHQLPLGVSLDAGRRTELLAWAAATSGLVVEDDYDGEFRYDRQPVGAIQGLSPEAVAYVGTVSKSLAPALRLGWLVLPERLVEPVVRLRHRVDRHSPTLDQLALARLITTGQLDRHLRRMRLRYRRRREVVLAALSRIPGITVTGIAAGYHATVLLPPDSSETAVLHALRLAGIAADGLADYRERPGRAGLVIGYGTPPQHSFPAAVESFATILRAAL
jgi:GntR family transcriptional regulator/MocR family aminotransferase